jgi:hypothetical protein
MPVVSTEGAAPTANTNAPATTIDTLIHTAAFGLALVRDRSNGASSSSPT